jgi:SAM-dependent methyltransferase
MEAVACYYCGSASCRTLLVAQDDLTGKPGQFTFVTCTECGLSYQHPRITLDHIRSYYDDEYIAHRKKTNWGILTPFYNYTMEKHDREKAKLVRHYVQLSKDSEILDVGCGAGTFLHHMGSRYGARLTGVDFKDLSYRDEFRTIAFHCGLFYEQDFGSSRFDLVTMWHFLEHDYDPIRALAQARAVLTSSGRLVIEVPRLDSLTFRLFDNRWPGLQAPQHTVLFTKEMLLKCVRKAGLDVVSYLPYGAFPAYFYLFAGTAFKFLDGRGLNLSKAIYPYVLGQLALSPFLLFEKRLNLAMQTVICRKTS